MSKLTLKQADTIIDAALKEGRSRSLLPLAIAVLDAGGNMVACKREDGAGIMRIDVASGKAWGSLGLGFGTREMAKRAATNPAFITTLAVASEGRVLPSPGGCLILDHDGDVIGAVGISGDVGDNDELCALAGITAAGFTGTGGDPASAA